MIETILRERNPSGVLPGDAYLAVGINVSPYIAIYKKNGDTFTRLPNPATLPTGIVFGVVWNGSTHLCCSHTNYPYVTVYKRAGDTFTKLADFTTNEGATLSGGRIAVNGAPGTGVSSKMAYTFTNPPRFKTVSISGDTFSVDANSATSLAVTPSLNTGIAYNVNSGSGNYLAVATQGIFIFTQGNPPVVISQSMPTSITVRAVATNLYDVLLTYGMTDTIRFASTSAGPTFGSYSPPTLSWVSNNPLNLAWDGYHAQFLAAASFTSGLRVSFWDTGSSFTTCTFTGTVPSPGGRGVAWSYSSILYLALASSASPFIYIYKQDSYLSTAFTKLSDPGVIPEGTCNAVAFSDPI